MEEIEFVSVFLHPTSYLDTSKFIASFAIHHNETPIGYSIFYRNSPSESFTILGTTNEKISCFELPVASSSYSFKIEAYDGLGGIVEYLTPFFPAYEDFNFRSLNKNSEEDGGMLKIENVSFFLHPMKYAGNISFAMSFFISHKEDSASYSVRARYDQTSEFEDTLLINNKFGIFFLKPLTFYLETLIIAFRALDGANNFFTIPGHELSVVKNFVKVWGFISDISMRPQEDFTMSVSLMPNRQVFEFGNIVVDPRSFSIIKTDSFGYFEIILPANKGSKNENKIKQNNTFYEFQFSDQKYVREINYDNGPVQSFTSLLEPEHVRKKKDPFYQARIL